MTDLKHWEDKIKKARQNTPWREFLKLASWYPFMFYKKDGFLSRYSPDNGRGENVVSLEEYNKEIDSFSDKYNLDYSGNFFQDMKKLLKITPLCAIKNVGENPNSDYGDIVFFSKNIYLSSVVLSSENVLYSFQVKDSKNVYNSVMVWKGSNNIYFSRAIFESYNVFYSSYIRNSIDVWFSSNLIGCSNCIGCNNLENQSYCIDNVQYSKEEYKIKKSLILNDKTNYFNNYKKALAHKGNNIACNVKGEGNIMCENVENSFWCSEVKNGRNTFLVGGGGVSENMYDVFSGGMEANNNFYGVMGAGYHTENIYCSAEVAVNSSYCYYSYFLEGCSYCIGCIGLKNKQYCILNKQYTKEERYSKANEIFAELDESGGVGKFFPGSMNPFYFNDTLAYLIDDSFTKEEVEAEGYLWRDEEIKVDIPEGVDVLHISDLDKYEGLDSSGKREINPEMLTKVICDEKGNYYKIVKMEYDFLMKYGLPLPRLHWLDRIRQNFKIK